MSKLRETFLEELRDLYDAEKQIARSLPILTRAAEHQELRDAFDAHLEETQSQIERLEQVFGIFGEPVKGKKCRGMRGLIEEGEESIDEEEGDVALICAAQKVEHYEIAAYGSLVSWAQLLDEREAAGLLDESLDEEKSTDEKLTAIAETTANVEESTREESAEEKPRGRRAGKSGRTKKAGGRAAYSSR